MNHREYQRRLHKLKFNCGMNQRYHQLLEAKWVRWDMWIRIIVGVLAIAGAILAVPGIDYPKTGFIVALVSVVAAGILNIVPVSDWAKFHGLMFRLWSELRKEAILEEHKSCEGPANEDVAGHVFDRLCDLVAKRADLDAEEPAPNLKLLYRCYGDELETEWGRGVRTPEQVERERKRRKEDRERSQPNASPVSPQTVQAADQE